MKTSEDTALQAILDRIPTGVCVYRKQGGEILCIAANVRCAAMLGMSREELLGKPFEAFSSLLHPDDRARFREQAAALLNGTHCLTGACRVCGGKSRQYRWLHLDGQLAGQAEGEQLLYFTFTDISETVRARHALELSRQAMNSIVRYAPGGVFVYSAEEDEEFSFVSENMLAMLGYTLEEFRLKFRNRFSLMVYEKDREATLRTIWEQIAVGPFDTCIYRIEKKDGTLMWAHDEGHIVTDENGKRWFYVVIVDITASEQTKSSLAGQNAELRRLVDSIPARIVVLKNHAGTVSIVAANGYLSNDRELRKGGIVGLSGQPVLELAAPEDREQARDFFARLFALERLQDEQIFRVSNADGGFGWVHCSALATPQEDGSVLVYAVFTDAAMQKAKEDSFNRTLQELLTTNPDALCTFRLNLTKNRCSDGHGTSEYIRQMLEADTVDGLMEKFAAIILDPRQAAEFLRDFSRERLLGQYAGGSDRLEVTYRRLTDSGKALWVTTYFHILQNPFTGDIEAIAYSVDADHAHKEEEILAVITREEYDCIGLIDTAGDETTYYYVSESYAAAAGPGPEHFGARVQAIAQTLPTELERKPFIEAIGLDAVRRALESRSVYTYSYTALGRRKQLNFRYLEADRREIMFTLADVTETFEHEEAAAEQLRRALLAAEKASEMKTDFLGNVSHDIRTPLNAILGYNLLAMQVPGTPPQVMDYLRKTETASDTLLTLINDTLDLQKIETGTVELKPVPVSCGQVIREIVTSVQPLMDKKHITFVLDNSRAVMATISVDLLRVREIFINLLSNAIKFTPEGGRIEFIVECLRLEPDSVYDRITVRDNGVGMSADFMEKMFEPFTQERTPATAAVGGSGLGLSIVKRTVELLGGRIEARSQPGAGSEFSVYLRFERLDDALPAKNGAPGPADSVRGLHLLLCEDNEMNAEIATRILQMNGADCELARNGEDACRLFAASEPGAFDAILMDLRMPVMDGCTAARIIRASAHPDAGKVPILAMSADAYDSDVEKTLRAGMNGHIAKPIDPGKLISEIARLVKR